MKKLISIILLICILASLCSCSFPIKEERFSKSAFGVFDTVITITAYDKSGEGFEKSAALVEAELEGYSRLFDIYNTYDGINNLCTVNGAAGKNPVSVDGDLIELLSYGKKAYEITHGAVNIGAGAVLKLWHEAREYSLENPDNARLPDEGALREAAEHIDISLLEIDEANGTVFISDEKASVDVGAIAKGFAANKIKQFIDDNALWDSYLISLGGNVITEGYKKDGANAKWNVEIENPDKTSASAFETVSVTDTSVVTSGDYQRYFTVDGVKYNHIINLDTLMPATEFSSVTVICSDAALADALSTALFILPFLEGRELVNGLDGVEAMWVDNGCEISYTEDFPIR